MGVDAPELVFIIFPSSLIAQSLCPCSEVVVVLGYIEAGLSVSEQSPDTFTPNLFVNNLEVFTDKQARLNTLFLRTYAKKSCWTLREVDLSLDSF